MNRVLPILFNTDMVRAILDGRKTVTRRVIKPKSKNACGFYVTYRKSDGEFMGVYDYDENEFQFDNPHTPPYQPGDVLYVRETWCKNPNYEEYYFKTRPYGIAPYGLKWKPSIHMPKEIARIFLKVKDVHVERLQDITEEQAQAEGCNSGMLTGPCTARGQFENLWNSTIKKSDLDNYGWKSNPWVWVIEFERCEKPELLEGGAEE